MDGFLRTGKLPQRLAQRVDAGAIPNRVRAVGVRTSDLALHLEPEPLIEPPRSRVVPPRLKADERTGRWGPSDQRCHELLGQARAAVKLVDGNGPHHDSASPRMELADDRADDCALVTGDQRQHLATGRLRQDRSPQATAKPIAAREVALVQGDQFSGVAMRPVGDRALLWRSHLAVIMHARAQRAGSIMTRAHPTFSTEDNEQ
jgi:hypothetical protein